MPYAIPSKFRTTTRSLFPETGERWLAHLPALLADLEKRWSIRIDEPFALSYNYVARAAKTNGAPVVLKVGHPHPELTSEMTALQIYAGRGIVRLLECDEEQGAMLLECIQPGVPLAELDDAQDDMATRSTAEVMRHLHLPAPADPDHRLITAQRWGRGFQRLRDQFNGGTGPFPAHLVDQAGRLFSDLLATSGPQMLLHGDLHHWNILSASRGAPAPRAASGSSIASGAASGSYTASGWLALDPKGLVAEAEYEVGAFTRNRWPGSYGLPAGNPPPVVDKAALKRQLDRRLAIFHEMLGFDRQRMLQWCMAQAMLSAWWTYEEGAVVETPMLVFAEAASEMIG